MKNYFTYGICLIVITIHLFAIPSIADDECSAAEASPAFSSHPTKLQDYKMIRDEKKHLLTESFKIDDGTTITVTQGGCAHFGKSITFTSLSADNEKIKIDTKFLLSKSEELLGKLPANNELVADLKTNLKSQEKSLLEQKPILENGTHKLRSTDETGMNTVILEFNEGKATTEMMVGLSISL